MSFEGDLAKQKMREARNSKPNTLEIGHTPLEKAVSEVSRRRDLVRMNPIFIPSKIIECTPVGPLSPYIDSYVRLLNEQGYAPASLHEHVRVIVMFNQSLQRSDCEIRDLDEAVVERFLYHELKEQWPHICAPAALRRLLAMLRRMGVTRGKPTAPRNPAQQLTADYWRFLPVERSLSAATAKSWLPFIEKFLFERFGAGAK